MRATFNLLLSVTVVTSLLFFANDGVAMCNLEKTSISIKAYDKPVAVVLKDIENQAEFTIDIPNPKLLSNKISIELDDTPLDLTLKRLLKGHNYSIICDEGLKTLTLLLLEGNTLPSTVSTTSKTQTTGSMLELSAALDDYSQNISYSESPHKDPPGMTGISASLDDYRQNISYPQSPHKDPPGMEGISAALDEYQNNKKYNNDPAMFHSQESSMDSVTEALEQYRIQQQNSENIVISEDSNFGEMAGVNTALDEYYKKPQENR